MTPNQAPLDNWTAAHIALGGLAGAVGVPAFPLFAAAAGYEVLEQIIERSPVGHRLFATRGPESAQNVRADLLTLGGAYVLVRGVRAWGATP